MKFSRVLSSQQLLLSSSNSWWCPKTLTSEAQNFPQTPPSTLGLEGFLEWFVLMLIMILWWYCGSYTSLELFKQHRTVQENAAAPSAWKCSLEPWICLLGEHLLPSGAANPASASLPVHPDSKQSLAVIPCLQTPAIPAPKHCPGLIQPCSPRINFLKTYFPPHTSWQWS